MNFPPFRKCPRGHPIDSEAPCGYCKQEDEEQEKADDKLFRQIQRLVQRGKLSKECLSGQH